MKQGDSSCLKMRQMCLLADTVQVLADTVQVLADTVQVLAALQDQHTFTAVLQRTAVLAGHSLAVL